MEFPASSTLPELGTANFCADLYAHVSGLASAPVDRHVFTCALFCLLGRSSLPHANHLLLRTQRDDISRLREMVLFILSHVFGLTTLHLKCRSSTTPDSLLSELVYRPSSETEKPTTTSGYPRRTSSSTPRPPSTNGRRPPGSLHRPSSSSFRPHSATLAAHSTSAVALPQVLVVTSLGRASHDTQEELWNVLRTRSCTHGGQTHLLPDDFLLVLLNDIGDGREKPHIIACMLDQFAFSSYVNMASSSAQPQSASTPLLSSHYLQKLKHHPLAATSPFLSSYMSALLAATTQHPLLSALLVGSRARTSFSHFTAVSAAMFSTHDGLVQTQHATQEDVARVYVHVVGHRVGIRNVGEGVLSILDRTLAPLPQDDAKEWKAGMKRRETVPQIMRDILGMV